MSLAPAEAGRAARRSLQVRKASDKSGQNVRLGGESGAATVPVTSDGTAADQAPWALNTF